MISLPATATPQSTVATISDIKAASFETIADFFAGLKKEGYNTVNPDYFSTDPKRGLLFNRISNIGKWKTKCGVS